MEVIEYGRFAAALLFVLGLIALAALAARRYGVGGCARPRTGEKRLSLVEVMPVDARRRLILIRRDGVEHLLLIGGTHDLVIESGQPIATPPTATPQQDPLS